MTSYYGWIPNVIGRLSFSFSGLSSFPSRVVFSSNLRNSGRFFAGFQRRDLSDTSIPVISRSKTAKRFIDRHFYGKTGDFYFLCLMKAREDSSAIQGKVFVYERSEWKNFRCEIRKRISEVERLDDNSTCLENYFDGTIVGDIFISSKFLMQRDGSINIDIIKAPDHSEFNEQPGNINHASAAQIYFFIRDLFHTHKFHSPDTDTILDVYKNDKNWKADVNYALARKAIALRRQETPSSLRRCIGIVSYLESFRTNMITSKERIEHKFSTKTFLDSATAAIYNSETREAKSLWNRLETFKEEFIKYTSVILAFAAIFISSDTIDKSEFLKNSTLVKLIRTNMLLLTFMILAILVTYYALKIFIDKRNYERDDFVASIARLSLPFKNKYYSFIIFITGMVSVTLSICLTAFIFGRILSGR